MAKYKTFQSVVNSVADSFTSLMNYSQGDYIMGHILTAARETGMRTLNVDLLSGHIEPKELLRDPIVKSIESYCADFPGLVERSGSDVSLVTSARMSIVFDIAVEQPVPKAPHLKESPFVCTVSLIDDRGKTYESVLKDWWYPEEVHKVSSEFVPNPPKEPQRGLVSRVVQFFRRFT